MFVSVRSYLSSGLAAATATVIVVAPMEVQSPARAEAPPVALAAQMQPLQIPAPTALGLPAQLPALIAQQVSFNTGVVVDFIATGAQLIGRQVQVAQTLVDDIRNGTPIPVAVGRAVVGFINIEVVAGHDLVGFGRELADFQIQFLGNLVSQLPPVIAAPAGHALTESAGAVGTVSDVANGIIDRLSQVTAIVPVAQSQSRQTSRNEASLRPDNIVTLRRDHPKSLGVEHDSTNTTLSSAGGTARRVTLALRDTIGRNSNVGSDHQQRHRRDHQQEQGGQLDATAFPLVGEFDGDNIERHRLVVAAPGQQSDEPAHDLGIVVAPEAFATQLVADELFGALSLRIGVDVGQRGGDHVVVDTLGP